METPLVSIVISTYNRASYLKQAIDNVLMQSYPALEVMVVDDASTDDTAAMLADYQAKDARVKYIRNDRNIKVAESTNRAIQSAGGEYIAIMDDDDTWIDVRKIEKQVAFLEKNREYVLVGGGAVWHTKEGKELQRYLLPENDKEIRAQILIDNCFVHSAVLFRKGDFEKTIRYQKQFGVSCDWALFLDLGRLGKFYNIPEYFVNHLVWDKNISSANIRQTFAMQIKLRRQYKEYYPGYSKAFFLSYGMYIMSPLISQTALRNVLLKIRTVLFGKPPYINE